MKYSDIKFRAFLPKIGIILIDNIRIVNCGHIVILYDDLINQLPFGFNMVGNEIINPNFESVMIVNNIDDVTLIDEKDCIIEQYSLVKDDSGVEIYEGDLIVNESIRQSILNSKTEGNTLFKKPLQVYFRDGVFGVSENIDSQYHFGLFQMKYKTVVGNIHTGYKL